MKLTIINKSYENRVAGSSGGGGGSMHSGDVTWSKPVWVTERQQSVTIKGTPPPPPSVALPTSQTGIMVPYMIGRERVMAPNIMWYGNLSPRYETKNEVVSVEQEEIRTIGNIGIEREFVTTTTVQTTTFIAGYTIDMQMGLCLGPGVHVRGIYANNVSLWQGDVGPARTQFALTSASEFLRGEVVFSGGAYDQAPDPFLVASIPAHDVPGYVGISHLIIFDIEATGTFPQVAVEVSRYPDPLALGVHNKIGDDVNVATAMIDFLTTAWGGAGISASKFNMASFAAAGETLWSEGNGCSLYIQQETTPVQVLKILQEQARGFVFEDPSTGLINFRLVREAGYDFDTIQLFNEDNVTDLRDLSKPSWNGIINQLRGTFIDRAGNYSDGIVIAQNLALLSTSGRNRRTATSDYPAVRTKALGTKLVARDLALASIPVPTIELQTNRDAAGMLPGDGFKLDWGDYTLDDIGFVVLKRRDQPKDNNQVTIQAVLMKLQTQNVTFAEPDDSLGEPVDTQPHTPLAVTIKTAPYWLMYSAGFRGSPILPITNAYPMLLAESDGQGQTSFDTYINNVPGAGRALAKQFSSYATVGVLNANLTQFQDVADGIVSSVQIDSVERTDNLFDIGNSGVRQGRLFMFIGNEILSFEAAVNLGSGSWRLDNVHRALIDTAPELHSAGARVYVMSNNINWITRTSHLIASDYTPDWLLVSRSVGSVDTIAHALADSSWSADGRPDAPYRPHNAKINGGARSASAVNLARGGSATITWASRTRKNTSTIRLQLDAAETLENYGTDVQRHRVKIRDSASVEFSCGLTTGSGDDNNLVVTIPGGAAAGAGLLWVQAESEAGAISFYRDYLPINLT